MRSRLTRALVATSLVLTFLACATESAEDSAAVVTSSTQEVEQIERVIVDDPTRAALAEVDDAIDADLPVRAAAILDAKALPAAREALSRAQQIDPRSEAARPLHTALVSAFEARVRALEQKERALARGVDEDLALADAFRAEREAEQRIVEVAEAARALREASSAAAAR